MCQLCNPVPTFVATTMASRLLIAAGLPDPSDHYRHLLAVDLQGMVEEEGLTLDTAAETLLKRVRPASLLSYVEVLSVGFDQYHKN